MRCRTIALLCCVLLVISCSDNTQVQAGGRVLSYALLTQGVSLESPLQLSEFKRPPDAMPASNTFSGRLRLAPGPEASPHSVSVDDFSLADSAMWILPSLDVEFVQSGDRIVPLQQGPIGNEHPWWEYVLRPGYVWDEAADRGFTRAAIPFALKERNADCIHNGLLSFLFNDAGEVSQVFFQISHQTCRYLQFEMYGLVDAAYIEGPIVDAMEAIVDVVGAGRMPQRPLSELAHDYAGIDPGEFGSTEEIDPSDMTAYGFVIDGIHYVSDCTTPYGNYPYCDEMALPSYSTAKSLVGGLSLMLAEKHYPGISRTLIENVVPECSDSWDGVTIEHALDLVTGHYGSSQAHGDEDAPQASRFFLAEDHAAKIDYACNAYSRKSAPGEHWSYQTWGTYLFGTALNRKLQTIEGKDYDFYDDLLVAELWQPLGLSKLMLNTRRTYDDVRQPFTGFGLTLLRSDVATLAAFLGSSDGRIDNKDVLDARLFDAIKQRRLDDPGMQAESELIRYNNGFRTFDVSSFLGCDEPTWLTTLSGYGGINIVLMPNATAYYYFSDGNVHRYLHAVQESHRLRSICPSRLNRR